MRQRVWTPANFHSNEAHFRKCSGSFSWRRPSSPLLLARDELLPNLFPNCLHEKTFTPQQRHNAFVFANFCYLGEGVSIVKLGSFLKTLLRFPYECFMMVASVLSVGENRYSRSHPRGGFCLYCPPLFVADAYARQCADLGGGGDLHLPHPTPIKSLVIPAIHAYLALGMGKTLAKM